MLVSFLARSRPGSQQIQADADANGRGEKLQNRGPHDTVKISTRTGAFGRNTNVRVKPRVFSASACKYPNALPNVEPIVAAALGPS